MSNPTHVVPVDMNRQVELSNAENSVDPDTILDASNWCAEKLGIADTAPWQLFRGLVKYSAYVKVMNDAFYSGENTNYLLVFAALLFLFELVGNLWLALSTGRPDSVHSSDTTIYTTTPTYIITTPQARALIDVRTALLLKTPCACCALQAMCSNLPGSEYPKVFGKTIKCCGPRQTSIRLRPRYFGLWTTLSLFALFIFSLLMLLDGFIYGDILNALFGVASLLFGLYELCGKLCKNAKKIDAMKDPNNKMKYSDGVAPVFCYPFCRKKDQFKKTKGWNACPFTGNNPVNYA